METTYNKRVEEANKQALSGQVGGAITSQSLSTVNPLDLPSYNPSTIPDAIIASSDASQKDFTKQAEQTVASQSKALEARQKETQGVMGNIARVYGDIKTTLSGAKEEENTIDPFRTELGNINTEIANQNVAFRGEADAIAKRGDISKEGQASLLQNVKDTYGRRLADLAIRQSAAQGNVTALESALDRKLEMALAPLKSDLQYYTDFELKNADALEQDEKDTLTAIKAEKQRLIDEETKKNTAISNILTDFSKNGIKIPDGVISEVLKAKSDLEANAILARNGLVSAKPVVGGVDSEQLYAGLSSATATGVRSKVTKFSSEPIVQGFATVQEGRNFAKSLSDTTKNPADDQGLIYALAKALDPNSVVREGEYNTAQKYAQSWVKAYGKGVEQALLGTGFLSVEARKNIKKTIENKYLASKTSYDNLYKNTSTSINNLTGRGDGTLFLTDYAIPETSVDIEQDSKKQVDEFIRANPNKLDVISNLYSDPEISDFDVVEYLRLQGLIK